MKFCRLAVVVICLLTVSLTAGWMISAVQAAPLNQAHPDAIKLRVDLERPIKFVFLCLQCLGCYNNIYEAWFGSSQ